ncbi:hypothetical protein AAHC03_017129 [Spirometra sp. Aus1]
MDVQGAELCFNLLERAHSTLEEYEFLVKLLKCVGGKGTPNGPCESLFNIEDEELLKVQEIAKKFNICWSHQAPLDWFVFYLFARRYESEWTSSRGTAVQVVALNPTIQFRQSTVEAEEQFTLRIKNVISGLISWLSGRPLSVQLLRTYVSTLKLAEKMPRMRKHLVSHSLKWLTVALASAPALQGRRTSRRGSVTPAQCPPPQLAFLCSHTPAPATTGGTAREGENASEGTGPQNTEPSPEEALTIAIEGLILASVSDDQSGIRKLTVGRLASYFENLPFASSLLYCDKFIRICRKTPDSLWHRQDGLLRLIHHQLKEWTQKYNLTRIDSLSPKTDPRDHFFDAAGQFLKRRVSAALVNAFTPTKTSHPKAHTASELDEQPGMTSKSIEPEDRRLLMEELLPSLLNLSASLVLSMRPLVRRRAALIYALTAACLPSEVQLKICGEILQFLKAQLQEISQKSPDIIFPSPDSKNHACLESLVSVVANLMPVLPTQTPGSAVLPDAYYVTALLLGHPSGSIRRNACNLLISVFTKLKDSQQELRNVVVCITQNWSPNQEVLLTPMKNFVCATSSKKVAVRTLGHLQAYCGICRLLVENDLQTEAAYLLPKTDMRKPRKSLWSVSTESKPPSSIYARRFTEINAPHNEKRRLSKDLLQFSGNSRPSVIAISMFKRNRSSSSWSGQSENLSLIEKMSLLEKAETRLNVWNALRGCSAGTSIPSSPVFFSSASPSENSSPIYGQTGFSTSPGSARPRVSTGANSYREVQPSSPRPHEVVGPAGTRSNSDFRHSLIIMLHASIEYLCDSSKELAQLAHETLKAVGHVAGLYDRTLLSDLITTHCSFEPTLLTYGCLKLLSYLVLQFAESYAAHSDGSRKAHDRPSTSGNASCTALLVSGMFNIDRSRLWLHSCEHYIGTRPVADCVTLDAVITVLAVLASLPHLGRASVQLSLRGRRMTVSSMDDSEEELETNSYSLDVDVTSLIDAVSSLEKLVERTGQSLRISNQPPPETDHSIGWLPDAHRRRSSLSPDASPSDALTFASQLLHAFVQTLEVGVALCVPNADPTNLPGLSVRHRLAVSDAETVALILSPLLPILARWPIYMHRTNLLRSPSSLDGAKHGTNRLHRRTLFFLLKVIWTICACLPKSEVVVAGSQTVFKPSPRRQSVSSPTDSADFMKDPSLQSAATRVNNLTLAKADMVAITESYLSTLLEIISTMRSQTFPASIFTSPNWWWIGQLCAVVPHLCYTAPQTDNSSLIEILCAELERHKGNGDGTNGPVSKGNVARSQSRCSSHREDAVDAMFVRVRRGSVMPAIQPTPPTADRGDDREGNQRSPDDLTRGQLDEDLGCAAPRAAVEAAPEERDEEEEAGDTDWYTDDDADTDETEVSSGRDVSPAPGHRPLVGQKSSESSQSEADCTFEPLGHAAIVRLVANLIKISDPGKIKPLKGQMPQEVIEAVKQILENAY